MAAHLMPASMTNATRQTTGPYPTKLSTRSAAEGPRSAGASTDRCSTEAHRGAGQGPPPHNFPAPAVGDCVWARFPHDLLTHRPPPKSRPCVIMRIWEPVGTGGAYQVEVIHGTTQRMHRPYPHEVLVTRAEHQEEFESLGLLFDTKFSLAKLITLEYNSEWFEEAPGRRRNRTPKLGEMHPDMKPRLRMAWQYATTTDFRSRMIIGSPRQPSLRGTEHLLPEVET